MPKVDCCGTTCESDAQTESRKSCKSRCCSEVSGACTSSTTTTKTTKTSECGSLATKGDCGSGCGSRSMEPVAHNEGGCCTSGSCCESAPMEPVISKKGGCCDSGTCTKPVPPKVIARESKSSKKGCYESGACTMPFPAVKKSASCGSCEVAAIKDQDAEIIPLDESVVATTTNLSIKVFFFPPNTHLFQGMDCAGCVITLKDHCATLKGLLNIEASAMTGVARVVYNNDELSDLMIVEHIRLLGHTVKILVDSVSVVFEVRKI